MREHKYRAWHIIQKRMYSAEEMGKDQLTLMSDGRGFANISSGDVKLSQIDNNQTMIPLQYTGIKDKNGREIYECDFLRFERKKAQFSSGIYLVAWDEEDCAFVCEREIPYNWLSPSVWHECEIIGNKYENPELIEK